VEPSGATPLHGGVGYPPLYSAAIAAGAVPVAPASGVSGPPAGGTSEPAAPVVGQPLQLVVGDDWIGLRDTSGRASQAAKRALDVVIALSTLLVLMPLMAAVCLAIRIESGGPVIFSQERVGSRRRRVGGERIWEIRTFIFYKFRTMQVDTPTHLHRDFSARYMGSADSVASPPSGPRFKPPDRGYVTRVGRVLRRLSIDELPQLWNVIRGDMSLVGPRPPMTYEAELYQPHHLGRLATLPGITGWAQVNGRSNCTFEEIIDLDREYVAKRSLLLDLAILFRTVRVVLTREGAG
jgi:lipopolysaccharide/colanic/teichoic acid biosynthesis glycosyltransferase